MTADIFDKIRESDNGDVKETLAHRQTNRYTERQTAQFNRSPRVSPFGIKFYSTSL